MKKILFSFMIISMVLLSASIAFTDDRYIENGDCITDTKTGLIWTKDTDLTNGKCSSGEAIAKLAKLNSEKLCNVRWHMPTIGELRTILDSYPDLKDMYWIKYIPLVSPPASVSPPVYGLGGINRKGEVDRGSYENHFIAVGK